MSKTTERIKVAMRCRPLNEKEIRGKHTDIVTIDEKRKEITLTHPKKTATFTFDFVYGQNS